LENENRIVHVEFGQNIFYIWNPSYVVVDYGEGKKKTFKAECGIAMHDCDFLLDDVVVGKVKSSENGLAQRFNIMLRDEIPKGVGILLAYTRVRRWISTLSWGSNGALVVIPGVNPGFGRSRRHRK
jgi:hypothetical protein